MPSRRSSLLKAELFIDNFIHTKDNFFVPPLQSQLQIHRAKPAAVCTGYMSESSVQFITAVVHHENSTECVREARGLIKRWPRSTTKLSESLETNRKESKMQVQPGEVTFV